MTSVVWLHEVVSVEGLRFRIGRRGTTRVAEWDGLLRLEAPAKGNPRVICAHESLASRKLRQGAVPALLGHLTGQLHWHAAACELPAGTAIMILGDAGAGKSTLAAGLGTVGAAFLGDDITRVEQRAGRWTLRRTETRHAIRTDVAPMLFGTEVKSKALFAPDRRCNSAPLGAILTLEVGEQLEVRPLKMRQCVHTLQRHLVRFALDDAEKLERDLDVVLAILASVPVYTLVRPRVFDDWRALATLLQAALRGPLTEEVLQ